MTPSNPPLRITEIFYSLQGESIFAGYPTVFIRLTGCPLRCHYCDTAYAFHGGKKWSLDEILTTVAEYGADYVTVTGGEPLAQPAVLDLLASLCDAGYQVSLETSGAISVAAVDQRVVKVVDIKTPGSGEAKQQDWTILDSLTPQDQIKLVICDRADYEWAKAQIIERNLSHYATVWFSPAAPQQNPRDLADWIIADRLKVRLQLQLHKILWGDTPGK